MGSGRYAFAAATGTAATQRVRRDTVRLTTVRVLGGAGRLRLSGLGTRMRRSECHSRRTSRRPTGAGKGRSGSPMGTSRARRGRRHGLVALVLLASVATALRVRRVEGCARRPGPEGADRARPDRVAVRAGHPGTVERDRRHAGRDHDRCRRRRHGRTRRLPLQLGGDAGVRRGLQLGGWHRRTAARRPALRYRRSSATARPSPTPARRCSRSWAPPPRSTATARASRPIAASPTSPRSWPSRRTNGSPPWCHRCRVRSSSTWWGRCATSRGSRRSPSATRRWRISTSGSPPSAPPVTSRRRRPSDTASRRSTPFPPCRVTPTSTRSPGTWSPGMRST